MSDVAPAGWYAGPAGKHQYRYWNGSGWTDHVSDDGAQSIDPLTPKSPPQTRREARRQAKADARAQKHAQREVERQRAAMERQAKELADRQATEARAHAAEQARQERVLAARAAERERLDALNKERAIKAAAAEEARKRMNRRISAPEYPVIGADGYPSTDIEGEFARTSEIHLALGAKPRVDQEIIREDLTARLVPEPENAYDPNAIMVIVNRQHVGYLSREDAIRYHEVLTRVFDAGYAAATGCRIWASARKDWQTGKTRYVGNVRVALGEPHTLLPLNDPPTSGYSILPWGGALQVTGEEHYQDVLSNYINAEGDGIALGTLTVITGGTARAPKELVEIRIDGERIGQLTPGSSQHFLPAIRHLENQGLATVAWLRVKGSAIAAQVTIQATKSHEIPADWFSAPITIPRLHGTVTEASTDRHIDDAEIRTAMREPMWDEP